MSDGSSLAPLRPRSREKDRPGAKAEAATLASPQTSPTSKISPARAVLDGTGVSPERQSMALNQKASPKHRQRALRRKSLSSIEMSAKAREAVAGNAEGVTIADFELLDKLGEGGGGTVWRAKKRDTGATYALKIISKSTVVALGTTERLLAERAIMSMVNCPFICKMHFAFQDETQIFFVLELVEGGDFLELLQSRPGRMMSEPQARFYVAELVLALEHLHSKKVVFRDLKPENVLVTKEGHIKIADFGLATKTAETKSQGNKTLCGTPEYMAPEVIREEGHGMLVDLWALGCMTFEMVEGRVPWADLSVADKFVAAMSAEPDFGGGMSDEMRDFVLRLMAKEPAARLGAAGLAEVKQHPWLAGVDWERLGSLRARPPIRPAVGETPPQQKCRQLIKQMSAHFKPYADAPAEEAAAAAAEARERRPSEQEEAAVGMAVNELGVAFPAPRVGHAVVKGDSGLIELSDESLNTMVGDNCHGRLLQALVQGGIDPTGNELAAALAAAQEEVGVGNGALVDLLSRAVAASGSKGAATRWWKERAAGSGGVHVAMPNSNGPALIEVAPSEQKGLVLVRVVYYS